MRPLTLDDRPLVNDYLRRYPPQVSELTFTNLFAWRYSRPVWLAEFQQSLLFFAQARHDFVLLGNPIGPVTLAEVLAAYGDRLDRVERYPKDMTDNTEIPSNILTEEDRDNADYVYRVQDLAELPGRHFAGKRNHITRCLNEHDCRYEEISAANLDECLAMQERWCAARDCGATPGLCGEFRAIVEALTHFEAFALTGGAIRIGKEIEAFTVAEPLAPGMAVCHFEKAMPHVHGLGQLINQWFAQFGLAGFTYVNREQDLGIPGLRQAKESYHPEFLVEKVRLVLPAATSPAPFASPPPAEAARRCPE
ncbi:MAG: DUF2156 domain-containing protein [Thermodesulfobacteriota bacterium]